MSSLSLSLSSLQLHGEQSLLSFYVSFSFDSLWLFFTNIVGKLLFRRRGRQAAVQKKRQASSCSEEEAEDQQIMLPVASVYSVTTVCMWAASLGS